MKETAAFWTQIMGEHADFIAHLLDPAERDLIMKAMQTADGFHNMHNSLPASKDPVERMVDEIIDFKVAGEKGIIAGTIKSIPVAVGDRVNSGDVLVEFEEGA